VTAPRSDGPPGDVNHSITRRCSEGWPLVPAEDPRPEEDLYNGLEFHPPWTRNSLDLISWGGGETHVSQQIMKPVGGDRSFRPKGLHLLSIFVQLLTLCVY
jgi:hypothetical protein